MADLSEHYSYHRTTAADDDLAGWLLELLEGPEWHKQAACRGKGAEEFYGERGEGSKKVVGHARILCAGCPVKTECLEAGIDERHGVWGGTSPYQRRVLRVERNRRIGKPYGGPGGVPARCGTDGGYYRHRRLGEDSCQACKSAHSEAERLRTADDRTRLRFAARQDAGACPRCSRYEHDKCKLPCACDKCHPPAPSDETAPQITYPGIGISWR